MFFCFGIGYSAKRVLQRGIDGAGTCRSADTQRQLAGEGISAVLFDDESAVRDALARATHVLSSVPPDEQGDPVLRRYGKFLGGKWLGYFSTTGVYGDHHGEWVDEMSQTRTTEPRLLRRMEAEAAWHALSADAYILRLSGIYGPGRNALEDVKDGTARRIDKPGQMFSRIHVEDIATTVMAAMRHRDRGGIYNVCDDEPAPSAEVIAYACALLGVEPPPLIPYDSAELSPMARSFYASNRRVSNRRLKERLGVKLAYPTYREGLRSLPELV